MQTRLWQPSCSLVCRYSLAGPDEEGGYQLDDRPVFFRFATLHRQQACEEFLANVERHAMKSWSWDEPGKKISRKDDDVLVEKGFLVPVCQYSAICGCQERSAKRFFPPA